MSPIFRYKISGEQINVCTAGTTGLDFDPEKVFDCRIRSMTEHAVCPVEAPKLSFKLGCQLGGRGTVRSQIEGGDLLLHDPIRHGIDVIANDVTSEPIGLA
jgi:hypothetical protein